MCCCQPERLRFKLDPQDVCLPGGSGGQAGEQNARLGKARRFSSLVPAPPFSSLTPAPRPAGPLPALQAPRQAERRVGACAGAGRGQARAHQVLYLFHPFQPFLLAVSLLCALRCVLCMRARVHICSIAWRCLTYQHRFRAALVATILVSPLSESCWGPPVWCHVLQNTCSFFSRL